MELKLSELKPCKENVVQHSINTSFKQGTSILSKVIHFNIFIRYSREIKQMHLNQTAVHSKHLANELEWWVKTRIRLTTSLKCLFHLNESGIHAVYTLQDSN